MSHHIPDWLFTLPLAQIGPTSLEYLGQWTCFSSPHQLLLNDQYLLQLLLNDMYDMATHISIYDIGLSEEKHNPLSSSNRKPQTHYWVSLIHRNNPHRYDLVILPSKENTIYMRRNPSIMNIQTDTHIMFRQHRSRIIHVVSSSGHRNQPAKHRQLDYTGISRQVHGTRRG